ncbi:hypothetical protein M9M90_01010 [Phenylobacterium sp. LH3H17]|uniref:PEP/pyruvate-binding domain-containing protein n=1 Tax=Phenylobacterium sp. LH3H17 TaxID=2903901 RepID=UPI0020C93D7A|nr:PEP/pyruvate-binding domain-containing protein [Phenylobacterium sp. LH3H17]UTP39784.1 hypothetical protein M9M90_01010 [Phenylobacterium sp. LH3H17]
MSLKAKNLEILGRNGVAVPRGFALSEDHFAAAVSPYASAIVEALPDADRIAAIIQGLPTPPLTRRRLTEGLAALGDASRFAVRSSAHIWAQGQAVAEDSEMVSMAGQFESYLNVPRHQVMTAVRRCWASLFNDRSLDRFKADAAYVAGSRMAVIVQEMVVAKASAVMMTADPQGSGETGAVEFAWGPCEAIVAGMVSPDEATFDRRTGRVLSLTTGRKELRVAYGAFSRLGENITRLPTSPAERATPALSPEVIDRLIALGCRIETLFGRPQDIEAVVDAGDRIVITQARSVTTLPPTLAPLTIAAAV